MSVSSGLKSKLKRREVQDIWPRNEKVWILVGGCGGWFGYERMQDRRIYHTSQVFHINISDLVDCPGSRSNITVTSVRTQTLGSAH